LAIIGALIGSADIGNFSKGFRLSGHIKWPKTGLWWSELSASNLLRSGWAIALRRKAGPVPVAVIILGFWLIGAAGAGLALRNNADTHVGFVAISLINLAGAVALTWPDMVLVRFLAFKPLKASAIIYVLIVPAVVVSMVISFLSALCIGLSLNLAIVSTSITFGILLVWLAHLIYYGMTKSAGGAVGFALRDLVLAALIRSLFLSDIVAVVWLIANIFFNYTRLEQRRWREPQ
jgi:hypothetical protein